MDVLWLVLKIERWFHVIVVVLIDSSGNASTWHILAFLEHRLFCATVVTDKSIAFAVVIEMFTKECH